MDTTISFVQVTPEHYPFLFQLYCSTRWEELLVTAWTDTEKIAFLRQQLSAQTQDWARTMPNASREIIVADGSPAGRVYVDRRAKERDIRVVDISLLPAFRNRGIGTRIFEALFEEADEKRWKVSIHVEGHNPARRLYDRLGFLPMKEGSIYTLMERSPRKPALTPIPTSDGQLAENWV